MTSAAPSTVLLVAGVGRSGTSTAAGALSRLGYTVPQPEVPADETNPRGFYEPQWAVDFHKRLLNEAAVRTNDARPEAVELTQQLSARPELLVELSTWLSGFVGEGDLVVKDPRTFWFHDMWRKATHDVGADLRFLTMLRHPAEVARSRDTHYLASKDAAFRRSRETTNVASWCHGLLVTEQITREDRRSFVLYPDLMADWRTALRRAAEQIGAGFMAGVTEDHHPVDDFIDTKLNRSQVTWGDMSVHPEIREIADEVWDHANRLVADPSDAESIAAMDDLHRRYDRLYHLARDLTLDQMTLDRDAHRRAQRDLREANKARVQRLRTRVDRLERRLGDAEARNADLAARLEHAERSLTNRLIRRVRRR